MTYLLSQLCWWIVAALVIGLVTGWLTFSPPAKTWRLGWLSWGLLAFIVGCVVAVLKWLPDAPGFWLEAALFLFAAYIVGCFLGAWIRSLFGSAATAPKPVAEPVSAGPIVASPVMASPVVTQPVMAPPVVASPAMVEPIPAAPIAADTVVAETFTAETVIEPAFTPPPAVAPAPMVAKPAPAVAPAPVFPGIKPPSIAFPRGGADDLKLIKGIGPSNEKILNDLGVYRYCQIGAWTADNADWVGHFISFPGRIQREQWIEQGRLLCAGIDTEYSRAVRAGAITVDDKADAALSDADISALRNELPQFSAKVENEDNYTGARPLGFSRPIGGVADDLKLIKGIGHQNEGLLHGLGIWHFHQIAAWTEANAEWIGSYLAFPGRIEREDWIGQARILARGGSTEFAERVKRGEVETSVDDGSQGKYNVEQLDLDKI